MWHCPSCVPRLREDGGEVASEARKVSKGKRKNKEKESELFNSHCAREPLSARRMHPKKLSVAELR